MSRSLKRFRFGALSERRFLAILRDYIENVRGISETLEDIANTVKSIDQIDRIDRDVREDLDLITFFLEHVFVSSSKTMAKRIEKVLKSKDMVLDDVRELTESIRRAQDCLERIRSLIEIHGRSR